MTWFRKPTTLAIEEAVPSTAPVRVPAHPSFDDDEGRKTYIDTARKLGVINAAVKLEMLLDLLQKKGLGVYPYKKVEAYLDEMFGKAVDDYYPSWGWRPLRAEDNGALQRTRQARQNPNGDILRGVYQKAIPYPVLLTVQEIIETVPGVHFFVSDEARRSNFEDPFLAVSCAGMDMCVIERWDEPSFRA